MLKKLITIVHCFQALALLDDFLRTCDRKVEAAKKRLEDQELDPESESRANKVHDIAEQIGQKLAKAEQLGNSFNSCVSFFLVSFKNEYCIYTLGIQYISGIHCIRF